STVWIVLFFFFSSRRRHTRFSRDWSSDVCSSDLSQAGHPHSGGVRRGRAYGLSAARFLARSRSVRLTHSCLNRNKADFLLHRGRFHSGLAARARAFLSTG